MQPKLLYNCVWHLRTFAFLLDHMVKINSALLFVLKLRYSIDAVDASWLEWLLQKLDDLFKAAFANFTPDIISQYKQWRTVRNIQKPSYLLYREASLAEKPQTSPYRGLQKEKLHCTALQEHDCQHCVLFHNVRYVSAGTWYGTEAADRE